MLILLVAANALSVGDRMLLSVATEPVRLELGLTDPQMALANGFLFAVFNLLGGLMVARYVDRGNRKRILVWGIAGWSLATAATGLATDFTTLAIARVAVGLGEATVFPAAMSLIPDLFERPLRGRAIAGYQTSGFIGVTAFTSLAGWMAGLYGWRTMFLVFGVAGILFALVVQWSGTEPPRPEGADERPFANTGPRDITAACRRVFSMPGFASLTLAFGLAGLVAAVVGTWGPAILQRSHGVSLAQVGVSIGLASGLCGVLGTLLAGVLVDALSARGAAASRMLFVPIVALPLSAPFLLGFAFSPTFGATVIHAGAMSFMLGCGVAPCLTYAMTCVSPQDRGVAAFVLLASAALVGSSLGPLLVAELSNLLAPRAGSESLRLAFSGTLLAPVMAAVLLEFARRKAAAPVTLDALAMRAR